jgi:hypothetical protein
MNLSYKINRSELSVLLRLYTRKFIQVLLRGERYPGEYERRKRSLNRLQKMLLSFDSTYQYSKQSTTYSM